jgi:hypothetical protein
MICSYLAAPSVRKRPLNLDKENDSYGKDKKDVLDYAATRNPSLHPPLWLVRGGTRKYQENHYEQGSEIGRVGFFIRVHLKWSSPGLTY